MNLHQIVAGAVGAVNPLVPATLRLSVGYQTQPDGSQVPLYSTFANVLCQVQALTQADLRQLDGMNIQGSMRTVYLNGSWRGVVRVGARGGDLLTLATGDIYLVTSVLELWPDWTKLSVTLQDGS